MQKQHVNNFIAVFTFALLCNSAQGAVSSTQKTLKFDDIFNTLKEPKSIYYKANFSGDDGKNHTLQVWRDGQLHLRRKTDDAIDTYIIRNRTQPSSYQMIIVDYKKRISTRINRNNLIHLGSMNDWFDMSHALKHPHGDYKLTHAISPYKANTQLNCQWFQLQQNQFSHHICWSPQDHIPLEIWDDQKKTSIWKVSTVNHQKINRDIFQLHDDGFMRNDANEDIEND